MHCDKLIKENAIIFTYYPFIFLDFYHYNFLMVINQNTACFREECKKQQFWQIIQIVVKFWPWCQTRKLNVQRQRPKLTFKQSVNSRCCHKNSLKTDMRLRTPLLWESPDKLAGTSLQRNDNMVWDIDYKVLGTTNWQQMRWKNKYKLAWSVIEWNITAEESFAGEC